MASRVAAAAMFVEDGMFVYDDNIDALCDADVWWYFDRDELLKQVKTMHATAPYRNPKSRPEVLTVVFERQVTDKQPPRSKFRYQSPRWRAAQPYQPFALLVRGNEVRVLRPTDAYIGATNWRALPDEPDAVLAVVAAAWDQC